MAGEEGIPQGLQSPFSSWPMERPKAEALGYLEAKGNCKSKGKSRSSAFGEG
jgi:hypothetical protein